MSNTLELDCPGCGQTLQIDAGFIGGVCRCSHCGAVIAVDGSADNASAHRRPDSARKPGSTSGSDFDRISVVSARPGARPEPSGAASTGEPSLGTRSRASSRDKRPPMMLIGVAGGAVVLIAAVLMLVLVLPGGDETVPDNTSAADTHVPTDPTPATGHVAAVNPWDNPGPQAAHEPSAPEDPAPGPDGMTLKAAWEFQANANDSSGSDDPIHGKLVNGASIVNGRLVLDGEDDHVQVPIGPGLNKPGQRLRIDIRFKASEPGRPGVMQVLLESGGGERGVNVYLYNNRIYCGGYNLPGHPESGWPGSWLRSDNIRSNSWHVITMELDAHNAPTPGALTAKLDGEPIGSAQGARVWSNTGWNGIGAARQNTRFHNGVSNKPSPFKGEIDFIRVYGN